MPSEAKPLFRADALRPKLVGFRLAATVGEARKKPAHWVDLLASKKAEAMKETELLPLFITDLFERLLGFTGPASGEATDYHALTRLDSGVSHSRDKLSSK